MAEAGTQLIHGLGVDEDRPKGLAMIQAAAARGDLNSIQNLAYWSRTPAAGVLPYDLVKSHAWLLQAAQAGDVNAMDTVGTDLIVDQGIPVDVKEGLRWCLLAADKGSVAGTENVAVIYTGGYPGVPADRAQAIVYFRKAIAGGSKSAAASLAFLYESTSEGQPPDYAHAVELLAPLAAQGDVNAQISLGVYYDRGLGVPVNPALAMEWFAKAAKSGSARAMHELAVHYLDGKGVPADEARAIQLYRQAAALGFAPSLDSMGMFTFKALVASSRTNWKASAFSASPPKRATTTQPSTWARFTPRASAWTPIRPRPGSGSRRARIAATRSARRNWPRSPNQTPPDRPDTAFPPCPFKKRFRPRPSPPA